LKTINPWIKEKLEGFFRDLFVFLKELSDYGFAASLSPD